MKILFLLFYTVLFASQIDEVFIKAKKEGKIVIIEATSKECRFCKEMENRLKKSKKLKSALKDFIYVRVDVTKEPLPLSLKWQVTPTFFFLDSDKKVIKTVPGFWSEEDFLDFLKRVKDEASM